MNKFPGHIACDSASLSELVIPLFYKDEVYAVLDLDSPTLNRFTKLEEDTFIELTKIIEEKIHLL